MKGVLKLPNKDGNFNVSLHSIILFKTCNFQIFKSESHINIIWQKKLSLFKLLINNPCLYNYSFGPDVFEVLQFIDYSNKLQLLQAFHLQLFNPLSTNYVIIAFTYFGPITKLWRAIFMNVCTSFMSVRMKYHLIIN